MIKIGICDDNAKIVSKIKRYVESYDKEKADIRTFKNGEELLAEEEVFDAIFLDIDMDGINGIETAQKIRIYDKDVKIIDASIEPAYRCDCNKEKFADGLATLGKKELSQLIEEDGKAEIQCQFCDKRYEFNKEELEEILKRSK